MAEVDVQSITTPVTILYCDACGMPPEYCEYGPDFETHCLPWLKKAHPDLLARMHGGRSTNNNDADDNDDGNNAGPTAPWTTKERLIAFYTKYQADKLDGIDGILEKYSGKEDKLFTALVKKYGPEPEDPFYLGSDSDDDDSEDGGVNEQLEGMDLGGNKKKRRGAAAKKVNKVDTRVIVQKISRNRKKAVTHVVGLDTAPGIKLKEASKAFSKRFAGSSSVKDKEIIIQGDHLEEVAEMIVTKFGVSGDAVFLDLDGEFVSYA
ncbi:DENR family protein [Skeletonema marinoi]|uniref:DENR family protein n=1 Tax=Skeletonema marinoi TaxID=267567 RepID=A0AAD9DEE1_9STRA|nr:DENR family protein [Skeletonema marinoi]